MADTDQATEEKQDQQDDSKTQVQSAELPETTDEETVSAGGSIDLLLDTDVPVSVVIGKNEMQVRQLLQLGPGSVVKLDKPIDEPADLYLRDTKFATGNIVVADGQFAIRIKQVLSLDDVSEN